MVVVKQFLVCAIFMVVGIHLYAAERFPIPYMPDKDLTQKAQVLSVGQVVVSVDMTRPQKVFHPLKFQFQFNKGGVPIHVDNPEIRFNMKMDMGRYISDVKADGYVYMAETILPKCMWGDNRWFGKLTFDVDGKCHEIIFFFDMDQ